MSSVRSLKDKIVTINMIFFSLILFLLFSLFFTYWLTSTRRKALDDLHMIAGVKASQFFDRLWSLDRLAVQLANDLYLTEEIFPTLLESPEHINLLQQDRQLNKEVISHILPYTLNNIIVSRICLFNDRNDFIFIGSSVEYEKTTDYYHSPGFNPVIRQLDEGHYRIFLPPRPDPFHYESMQNRQTEMLSLVRMISGYSYKDFIPLAYVEVQLDMSVIQAMFSDLDESVYAVIHDAEGHVIYKTDSAVKFPEGFTASVPIDNFDFTLTLYQNPAFITRLSLILGALLLLVLVLVAVGFLTTENFVVRQLTDPLDELHDMVNSVSISNMNFDYKMDGEIDQIRHLNLAFKEVLRRLNDSIDEKIEARTDELKAQLYALQAQMNPHFIHNTIAVISSLAEEHELDDIEDICTKLSRMIRYTSRYDMTNVALEDEIGHMMNYLELMKIRYENRVDCQIEGNFENQSISVPKFFLQPLVENCFNHGFKAVPAPWKLTASICIQEDSWFITIRDNGPGFHGDILKEIEALKNDVTHEYAGEMLKSLRIGGMGLKNVFARFFLRYRHDMIFEISNNPEGGALLTIGGPL